MINVSGETEVAVAVRVSSLGDLARLASSAAHMMVVMPIYRFRYRGKVVYVIQTIYKDFYKLYGIPVIYYHVSEDDGLEASKAKYLLIKVDEMGEKVEITDRTKPGWIGVPLVNLESKPPFIPDDIV